MKCAPITTVSNGRIKLYQEADIQLYEQDKPWLSDEISKERRQRLFYSLQFAKTADEETRHKILKRLFGKNVKL